MDQLIAGAAYVAFLIRISGVSGLTDHSYMTSDRFDYSISGFSFLSFLVQPSIAADIFPRRMRGIAQGALYGMQSLGGVTSYLAGGRFIEINAGGKGGWRCKPILLSAWLASSRHDG